LTTFVSIKSHQTGYRKPLDTVKIEVCAITCANTHIIIAKTGGQVGKQVIVNE
jgi:hypothetical protein